MSWARTPRTAARRRATLAALTIVTSAIAVSNPTSAGTEPADPPAEAPPAPASDADGKINWSPCFKEISRFFGWFFFTDSEINYECSVVPVPLDYDDPAGGSIQLSLVRLAATEPDPIGSLFLNPGGPGASGVNFLTFGAPFLYSSELRANFDLIGFDPRGVARSTALKCFGNLDKAESIFQSDAIAFPLTEDELASWFDDGQRLADACDQRGNKVLDHVSTANVARDLDLLRQALGEEQLNFAGYSYGSYIGQTYANMFPDRVRAIVIDAVLDPIAWSTGYPGQEDLPFSARLGSDLGAQATLEEFFRLCDESGPTRCTFAPDAAERYDALADRLLNDGPITFQIQVGLNEFVDFNVYYGDLIGLSLGAMYDSDSWPSFAMDLAGLEAAAEGLPAAFSPSFATDGNIGYTAKRGFPRYFNFVESFPGVACSDSDNPDDVQDWWEAAGQPSSENYFRQIWTYASSQCQSFPAVDDDRYTGPWTATTANPVLIVNTTFDPATPLSGAQAADSLLGNSELLVVEAWGHAVLGRSRCAEDAIDRYLIDLELPAEGIACAQDQRPFQPFFPRPDGPDADEQGDDEAFEQYKREARKRFFG